jgi:hypothetical protein
MKMKKTVAIVLVAIMLLAAVGCGASYTKEQVAGDWKVTKVKGDDDVQNLLGAHLNLTSGGTYAWSMYGIVALSGSYRLSGSRLYLGDDFANITSLDGNTMILKDSGGELTLVRE